MQRTILLFIVLAICIVVSQGFRRSWIAVKPTMYGSGVIESYNRLPTRLLDAESVDRPSPPVNKKTIVSAYSKKKGNSVQVMRGPPRRKLKEGVIEVLGRIVDALPSIKFMVELQPSKQMVRCTLCGKMIKHKLKVIIGDIVTVEVNSADISMGRITYRWKPGQTPQIQTPAGGVNAATVTSVSSVSAVTAPAEESEEEEDEDESENEDEPQEPMVQ